MRRTFYRTKYETKKEWKDPSPTFVSLDSATNKTEEKERREGGMREGPWAIIRLAIHQEGNVGCRHRHNNENGAKAANERVSE